MALFQQDQSALIDIFQREEAARITGQPLPKEKEKKGPPGAGE